MSQGCKTLLSELHSGTGAHPDILSQGFKTRLLELNSGTGAHPDILPQGFKMRLLELHSGTGAHPDILSQGFKTRLSELHSEPVLIQILFSLGFPFGASPKSFWAFSSRFPHYTYARERFFVFLQPMWDITIYISWFLVFGGVRHRGEHPSRGIHTKGNKEWSTKKVLSERESCFPAGELFLWSSRDTKFLTLPLSLSSPVSARGHFSVVLNRTDLILWTIETTKERPIIESKSSSCFVRNSPRYHIKVVPVHCHFHYFSVVRTYVLKPYN